REQRVIRHMVGLTGPVTSERSDNRSIPSAGVPGLCPQQNVTATGQLAGASLLLPVARELPRSHLSSSAAVSRIKVYGEHPTDVKTRFVRRPRAGRELAPRPRNPHDRQDNLLE